MAAADAGRRRSRCRGTQGRVEWYSSLVGGRKSAGAPPGGNVGGDSRRQGGARMGTADEKDRTNNQWCF